MVLLVERRGIEELVLLLFTIFHALDFFLSLFQSD